MGKTIKIPDVSTPVLIMGGQQNALSITRSLGRQGVSVSVSAGPGIWATRSRYCSGSYTYSSGISPKEFWKALLLDDEKSLQGYLLLSCNDDAIEFIATYKNELKPYYILDENIPELQHAMLDKQKTLQLANEVGCPIPQFWNIESMEDVYKVENQITFPAMIKPIHSHVFRHYYPEKKYLLANDFQEVTAAVADTQEKGLEIMICEMIPGPDTLLSSYYTYLDDQDRSLFHFTKKVIRRYPVNSGLGTYHITEWDPETAEMGEKFFRGIKFRGLGNIEFKRDLRDGKLKVIECNNRFTAAQELLVECGMDISLIVYCRLTGQATPSIDGYLDNRRLLEPVRDFFAFRQLKARGEITFMQWVASLMHKQVLSYFRWYDPLPAIACLFSGVFGLSRRLTGSFLRKFKSQEQN